MRALFDVSFSLQQQRKRERKKRSVYNKRAVIKTFVQQQQKQKQQKQQKQARALFEVQTTPLE
jgi:hypothetical protein|tara:strand:+ start:105 stop:293 length:189 start_codon:yes stop_codon:yes gene_type:complete